GPELCDQGKVQQVETTLHASRLELLEAPEYFGDGEPELRAIAARALPPPAAARRELHPHAYLRPDANLLGVLQNQPQLGVLLDDGDDVPPDLLGQHRHLDE